MTQRTIKSLDAAVKGLRSINERQFRVTYKKVLQFYLDKLIIRHFLRGYARRQKWTPNDPAYQAWKDKNFGELPQLVLHGQLRRNAKRGRVNNRGRKLVIRWRGKAARTYGIIQARLGRDWASPSHRDSKDMIRKFKREFALLRAKQKGNKVKRVSRVRP